jgi:hypothetical protein
MATKVNKRRVLRKKKTEHFMAEVHIIDQVARDSAETANARIASHEKLCDERWKNQALGMMRLEQAARDVKVAVDRKIDKVPAAIIALLTSALGFLVAKVVP